VRKILLLIVTANLAAAPICAADNPAATVESRGLVGTWASYCTAGAGRKAAALRIVFAVPPGGAPNFTTVNVEGEGTTTVKSEVLEAVPAGPDQLKLRLRIVGGEREGGPLPSPTTNTFEQVIEKTDQGIRLVGAESRFIQKCPD
jgi:hypothetical protein